MPVVFAKGRPPGPPDVRHSHDLGPGGGFACEALVFGLTMKERDVDAIEDPEAQLENALIEGFLHARGFDRAALRALPADEARRVLTEASMYASAKMAEIESRARFVHKIHGQE
jgi:hypothetical protein